MNMKRYSALITAINYILTDIHIHYGWHFRFGELPFKMTETNEKTETVYSLVA